MVKVENGVAVREPVPQFLLGLAPESLADLSWTDPSLGVKNLAWWPEENNEGELGANKKWGAEVLTLDTDRKVVKVARKQVPLTAAEKSERDEAVSAHWASVIEARRYEAEVGGVVVDGMGIETTDRSKTLIGFKAVDAMRNPDTEFNFKTTTGFVTLTAAKVLEILDVVNARVQACFDREEVLLGAVADGSITAEMVEEGWPT